MQDVAAAVRTLRRDEGMIRAAQRCAGSRWRPPSQGENRPEDGFAAVDVAARDGTELGGLGGGGGGEEGWATGLGLEGFHSPAGVRGRCAFPLIQLPPLVFCSRLDIVGKVVNRVVSTKYQDVMVEIAYQMPPFPSNFRYVLYAHTKYST